MRLTLLFCFLFMVSSLHAQQRRMVVTVDDLPAVSPSVQDPSHARNLHRLADDLKSRGIPAIGFVNERWMYTDGKPDTRRTDLLEYWLDAGHDLGNHTYAHPSLHEVGARRFTQQIDSGDAVIGPMLQARGRRVKYFRHPFLHTGLSLESRDSVDVFLKHEGYEVAPVTVDNADYIFALVYWNAIQAGDSVQARRIGESYVDYMEAMVGYYEQQSQALLGYELPQVLLLHASRLNADHAGRLMDRLARRGYRFIGLEEALKDPAYRLPDTFVRNSGITWLHRWALTQGKRGAFFAGEPSVPEWIQEAFSRTGQ